LIVGTAFTCDKSGDKRSSSTKPQCILFTYNLRGELHKCITFSPPKEATLLLMTITLDGEYIILNESQHVIKIIRTFDMTPLCALNTSDVMPNFLGNQEIDSSQVSNCIKSLLLVDYKYLLVGTDNGRLIIYRLDFNRWHHEYSSRY
jgi:rugose, isoform F